MEQLKIDLNTATTKKVKNNNVVFAELEGNLLTITYETGFQLKLTGDEEDLQKTLDSL